MQSYYVGLDVHSKESVFVIEDQVGASVARGTIPTTTAGLARLRDQYGLAPGTPVALKSNRRDSGGPKSNGSRSCLA